VPLVFDYQGSLTHEMVDHRFLAAKSPLNRPLAWLERTIERLSDLTVTSSLNAARALQAAHPDGPPVRCLADAVDTTVFCPPDASEVAALRARLGIPASRDVVGYLGLLAEYQGVGHLLYAARRILEARPHTHFLVMGYPGLEQYRRQAYDLQILDNVTFTGRVPYPEAPRYLALLDVAVSAKLSETEANGKLLDYMAMALPTVAYGTPVAREILGHLGVYAPPGDIAALAVRILELLDAPDRRRALGPSLRDRAQRNFSWDAFGVRLETLYTELLAPAARVRRRWPLLSRVN
jgi:glycosyltransferase involved in cell wall biosynthesis